MNDFNVTLAAGFKIGVVCAHVQASNGLEFGKKIKKGACQDALTREHYAFGFVARLAQRHKAICKLGLVLDVVPGF